MASRIRGITIEINGDTTQLDKALKDSNKQLSTTQSALKDVEKLLKMDPGNAELLAQKQKLLGEAVEANADRLAMLEEASRQADEALARQGEYDEKYADLQEQIDEATASLEAMAQTQQWMDQEMAAGHISTEAYEQFQQTLEDTRAHLEELQQAQSDLNDEFAGNRMDQSQYDALQRELIEAQINLKNAQEAADSFNDSINDVGDEGADNLDDLSDSAEDATDNLEEMNDAADGEGMGESFASAADAISNLADKIMEVVDAGNELRGTFANLYAGAEMNNYTQEQADEITKALNQMTGDLEGSMTAASAIMNTFNGDMDKSRQAVDVFAGAIMKFPNMDVAGLSQDFQQMVATGEAAGQFQEIMERSGMDVDAFNENMSMLTDESDRATLALNQLWYLFGDSAEQWRETNSTLVDARDNTFEVSKAQAEFAEALAPVTNKLAEFGTVALTAFNDLPDGVQGAIVAISGGALAFAALSGPVSAAASAIGGLINVEAIKGGFSAISAAAGPAMEGIATAASTAAATAGNALSGIGAILTGPVGIAIAIAAVIAGFVALYENCEAFREGLAKIDDFITGVLDTDFTEVFGAFGEPINALMQNIQNVYEAIKEVFQGIIDFVAGIFTGDWERAWEGVKEVFGGIWDGLVAMVKWPINTIIGLINGLTQGVADGLNAVIDALNTIQIDIPDWVPLIGGKTLGFNLTPVTATQIPLLASGAVLEPNSPQLAVVGDNPTEKEIVSPLSTIREAVRQAGGSASQPINITLEVDGRQFAHLMLPYMNKEAVRADMSLKGV